MAKKIYTLGYEGLAIERFIAVLKTGGVKQVIDVREVPLSRKPGFSKRALHERLNAVGIEYKHFVELGCPKSVRDQFRVDGDWRNYTRAFLRHLGKQGEAIADLCTEAARVPSCLICYEADFSACHRSFVAAAAAKRLGFATIHLAATAAAAGSKRAA